MGNIIKFLLSFTKFGIFILLFITIVYFVIKLLLLKNKLKQKYVIYEVKPLQKTLQSAFSTQQLFTLIHGLIKQRSFSDKLLGNFKSYAFEIVSTKEEGIRYIFRVNQEDAELIKRSLLSYLPGINVNETKEYIPYEFKVKPYRITDFKLSKHFAYPLNTQNTLKEYDPIAYITGSMTKLSKDDLISFQILVSPINRSTVKNIDKISREIYNNSDLVSNLNNLKLDSIFLTYFKHALIILIRILIIPIGILVFFASGSKEGPIPNLQMKNEKKKNSNIYQDELEILLKNKLDQPLFSSSIRLLVIGDTQDEVRNRIRGFISALSTFSTTYQSFTSYLNFRYTLIQQIKLYLFKNRLLTFFGRSILSTSEVADIYHFPYTSTTKTEDLVKLHSKQLPAPVSLKNGDELDVTFANNEYGGTVTTIGLTLEERRRHIYILGATGTGKSTILLSMINKDMKNGKGLCVIDPHGDLIENVLSLVPKERIKDVVYFNPDDIGYPIGINLLELSVGLSEEDSLREKEFLTESIISLFHKIYSDKYSGPRMEYILRNTIHTAFTVPNATLFTVYKLLVNTPFRKFIVKDLIDENLKDFWRYEFAKAGDYQKVSMISPITNKIGRFLFSPSAKRILEQEKSTVDFDEILNKGKILLCNVSKGKIGEDNSEVFGIVMMAKLQLAALKRARMEMKERRDFYLYVDEFQNFATPAFAQILSEARKYRLDAILAHQTTSQIEENSLVNMTLANTGTVICFRTANPEDERMILPQFRPYVDQGEIASLPSYCFYMRLGAMNPEEPFSGITTPVHIEFSQNKVDAIVESSHKLYTKPYVTEKQTNVKKTVKSEPKNGEVVP